MQDSFPKNRNNNTNTIKNSKRVSFHTLGCRLNKAETGTFTQQFIDRGYLVVQFEEPADVILINTCVVTDKAESVCRNAIRRARKSSPDGYIIVVGCYAEIEGENITNDVNLIIKTSEKHRIFDYIDKDNKDDQKVDDLDIPSPFFHAATSTDDGQTRAFLKIQDGCNFFCSYCIIPYARGRSRGAEIDFILNQASELIASGFKEIVLTGINIGDYKSGDNNLIMLPQLLKKLLPLKGLRRLRLSSIEPNTITDELLKIVSDFPNFMNHFHIPLQSGDDKMLDMMGRKYSTTDYEKVLNNICKTIPNVTIGTDIIVGHPGEDDRLFENTKNFLREIPISHFHIFPYSVRKGTKSALFPNQIEKNIKKMRAKELIILGEEKLQQRLLQEVGRADQVLFEQQIATGVWEGYTSNYLKVQVKSFTQNLKNEIKDVSLKSVSDDLTLCGELIL